MQLFNIGAEGQLYIGAICAHAASRSGSARTASTTVTIVGDVRLRRGRRRALGADPGRAEGVRPDERDHHDADAQLRRRAAADVPDLRQRLAMARRVDDPGQVVPAGGAPAAEPVLADPSTCAASSIPFGFLLAIGVAIGLWVLFRTTRFGFEMNVIGDSPRAARYSGMRTRRKILAVMAPLRRASPASAAPARSATSRTCSTPARRGSRARPSATPASSSPRSAATTRFAVVLVGVLIGGLQNAGLYLQGPDFPSALVGVHAGDHPVLRARRRAADPLPRALRAGGSAPPAAAEAAT